QARGEQGAQRRRALVVGVGVADPKRQRREYRAGVGALQALDADVLEHERLDRQRRTDVQRQGESEGKRSETERTRDGGRASAEMHAVGHWRPSRRAMSL